MQLARRLGGHGLQGRRVERELDGEGAAGAVDRPATTPVEVERSWPVRLDRMR